MILKSAAKSSSIFFCNANTCKLFSLDINYCETGLDDLHDSIAFFNYVCCSANWALNIVYSSRGQNVDLQQTMER